MGQVNLPTKGQIPILKIFHGKESNWHSHSIRIKPNSWLSSAWSIYTLMNFFFKKKLNTNNWSRLYDQYATKLQRAGKHSSFCIHNLFPSVPIIGRTIETHILSHRVQPSGSVLITGWQNPFNPLMSCIYPQHLYSAFN